jgi:hypothetical protein
MKRFWEVTEYVGRLQGSSEYPIRTKVRTKVSGTLNVLVGILMAPAARMKNLERRHPIDKLSTSLRNCLPALNPFRRCERDQLEVRLDSLARDELRA